MHHGAMPVEPDPDGLYNDNTRESFREFVTNKIKLNNMGRP